MLRLESNLPSYFTYHNAFHTKYVVEKSSLIAQKENISGDELLLLNLAALYHDVGFVIQREEHENLGCIIASKELIEAGVEKTDIDLVCGMIVATKVPQKPTTKLEKILSDADLEYLGTNHFDFFGQKLFEELKHFNPSLNEKQWYDIQIDFISNHSYHTDYCKQYKEPIKLKNLEKIKKKALFLHKRNN